jgi:hypothetical protein
MPRLPAAADLPSQRNRINKLSINKKARNTALFCFYRHFSADENYVHAG